MSGESETLIPCQMQMRLHIYFEKTPQGILGIHCPDCGTHVSLDDNHAISKLEQQLSDAGITVQIIPQNAKITVTFDV